MATATTDLLFENASGAYAAWFMNGTSVIGGGATIVQPGQGWVYEGAGDFNGDGTSDLLFHNVDTGVYQTYDLTNGAVSGGGQIGTCCRRTTFSRRSATTTATAPAISCSRTSRRAITSRGS